MLLFNAQTANLHLKKKRLAHFLHIKKKNFEKKRKKPPILINCIHSDCNDYCSSNYFKEIIAFIM